MRLVKLILALYCASFSAISHCAEYRQLVESLTPMASVSGFPYLHPVLKVMPASPGTALKDIRFTIKSHEGDISLPLDRLGRLKVPISDRLLKENPSVEVNQPRGTISLALALEVSAPVRQQFNYRLYEELSGQYLSWKNGKAGFFARLHMPSPRALLIRFPRGARGSASIALHAGEKRMDADGNDEVRIEANSDWIGLNPLISLNMMPEAIELYTD